jgi:hypothetical protein
MTISRSTRSDVIEFTPNGQVDVKWLGPREGTPALAEEHCHCDRMALFAFIYAGKLRFRERHSSS